MVQGFQRVTDLNSVKERQVHTQWDKDVWIGTLKTMGVGLTLTQADKVILLEPNSMPSDELQAQARAIRIGQKKTVSVIRLMSPDVGIEQAIRNINSLRQFLFTNAFIHEDNDKGNEV